MEDCGFVAPAPTFLHSSPASARMSLDTMQLGSSSLSSSPSPSESFSSSGNDASSSTTITLSSSSSPSSSAESPSSLSDQWPEHRIRKKVAQASWNDSYQAALRYKASEEDLIKERFSKLLLGEDLSGGGKGVSTALALSNAITNLSASIFGELWKLAPLSESRKDMWQQEIGRLLSVADYIVDYVPSMQMCPDGTTLKVMMTQQRGDLEVNLPALRKLDNMLMEALDSFDSTEFWYDDQDMIRSHKEGCSLQSQVDKWWLPIPHVPSQGLSLEARKHLELQNSIISQILKAALAVNAQVLSEMEVPAIYWDSLPKSGKASLGETIYRVIKAESFSPDVLISSMDTMQEHGIVDFVNRMEMAFYVWQRKLEAQESKIRCKEIPWGSGKDGAFGMGRTEVLIDRANSILLRLRDRFPGLPQSTLDVYKIQYNKDVGQSILESYSRVLESLAFNTKARITDILHVDDMRKGDQSLQFATNLSPGSVASLSGQLSPGCLCGVVNQLHSWSHPGTPLRSPARGVKFIMDESKELGEHARNVLPWYKHLSFAPTMQGLCRRHLTGTEVL